MSNVTIRPGSPLKGEIEIPGDKSISHRAIILASIAEGRSRITNFLAGEDCISTINIMRAAGVEIEMAKDYVSVSGASLFGLKEPEDVVDAGNSGTTTRLLSGLFASQNFFTVFTGDKYLRKRPMKRVVDPLRLMGASIYGRDGGNKLPLAICGTKLKGIEYHSPVASAQVKSSILLAGLSADGTTTVYEPSLSRDHSERMLMAMGAKAGRLEDGGFSVEGGHSLSAVDIEVPGDISSAAFFIVAALIVKGSEIVLKAVGVNPTRTGIIDILLAMGGDIRLENERDVAGEPVADIVVKAGPLKGVEIAGDLIPRAIDELPVVAVAAAFAEGTTIVREAKELRVKECDRISAICSELKKLGANIKEREDGFVVEGGAPLKAAPVESYDDHRIAMSMAIAALKAKGETSISDPECVNISFPGFFDLLQSIQR